MSDDIGRILSEWPFSHDEDLIVRIVDGKSGPKLQMRIDMGVIQMEMDGTPNGESPKGYPSWFDYYLHLRDRADETAVDDLFTLSPEDCEHLRREAIQYYYRYLCLTKLGDHTRVVRDTERNLKLFGFIRSYAERDVDKWASDQYRPYIIMMYTQAKASLAIKDDSEAGIEEAIAVVDSGIADIFEFFNDYGLTEEIENSMELSVLKTLKTEFLHNLPQTAEDELESAVREERFEDAAKIRDRMRLKDE